MIMFGTVLCCLIAVAMADQNQVFRVARERCRDKNVAIVAFPTVPRSGNSLFRTLFSHATRLPTQAVYAEGMPKVPGIDNIYSHAHNFDVCTLLIKTHFPFLNDYVPPFAVQVRTLREPLSNFLAWLAYCEVRTYFGNRLCNRNVTDFFARWSEHNRFWDSIHGFKYVINFDDLQASPVATMTKFFNDVPYFGTPQILNASHVFESNRIRVVGDCASGRLETVGDKKFGIDVSEYLRILRETKSVEIAQRHNLRLFCL